MKNFLLALLAISTIQLSAIPVKAQTFGRGHGYEQERPQRPELVPVECGEQVKLFLPRYIVEKKELKARYEVQNSRFVRVVYSNNKNCEVRGLQPTQATQVVCHYTYEEGSITDHNLTKKEDVYVFYVEVLPVIPQNVSLDQNVTVGWGLSLTPNLVFYPQNASCGLNWWVDDTNVATVNANGEVYGKALGETTLHVETQNGLSSSAILTVGIPACKSVNFEDTDALQHPGDTYQFHATFKPEHAEPTFRWSSSDPKIIAIDEKTGEAQVVGTGKATIYLYSDNGCRQDRKFKIKESKK